MTASSTAGGAGGFAQRLGRQIRPRDLQVLGHGAREEERLLQHEADVFPQMGQADSPDVRSADRDAPTALRELIEPGEKVREGRFPLPVPPRMPTVEPAGTEKLTSLRTGSPP
jgi:hypothetical protein